MSSSQRSVMKGVFIEGNKKVAVRSVPVPEPGPGEILLKTKASSICGSDLHCIYRPDPSKWTRDAEGYFGVIAGHEPAGQVAKKGSNTSSRLKVGDRVSVFHVSGCHECDDCRMLRPCSCTEPLDFDKGTGRRAYGWQRDGGHAEYICCDEQSLVKLPDSLSYLSGAMIACGYGTAYSGVMKAKVSGHDKVLIIGLGPVGLSVAQICLKMGASQVHGVEVVAQRKQDAEKYGIKTFDPSEVDRVIGGNTSLRRGYEVVFDCSGASQARVLAIEATKRWGRMVFIGGYGDVTIDISPLVIQKQLTMLGTWTFSIAEHEELHRKLVEWNLHPDKLISHTFPIDDAETAYRLFDEGKSNKVAIVFD